MLDRTEIAQYWREFAGFGGFYKCVALYVRSDFGLGIFLFRGVGTKKRNSIQIHEM